MRAFDIANIPDIAVAPNDIDVRSTVNDQRHTPAGAKSQKTAVLGTTKDISTYKLKNRLEYAKSLGPMKQIFGNFVVQGELCLLGGDTGIGKSLLMYQLCNNLASGKNTFDLANECGTQRVLYYDFELSPQNLFARYPNFELMSDNFFVVMGDDVFSQVTEFTPEFIETDIKKFAPTVIVVDNIVSLLSVGRALQQQEEAIRLVRGLLKLRTRYGITIITLSHTIKIAKGVPLDKNQLQGSKSIINLCDSVLMLGSAEDDVRYLKSVKSRNSEGYTDVLTLRLSSEGNLQFVSGGWSKENELLSSNPALESNKDLVDTALYCFSGEIEMSNKSLLEKLISLGNTPGQSQYSIEKMKKQNIIVKQNGFLKLNVKGNDPF